MKIRLGISSVTLLLSGVAYAPLAAQAAPPTETSAPVAQPSPPVEPAPAAVEPVQAEDQAPQTEAAPDGEEAVPEDEEEIVIVGQALRGSVPGAIKPLETLTARDVRSYGASNIGELIEALAPQTRSGAGDGPPIVLLNGKRISGFGEIRGIPPEAISRTEILPEEVALQFGYRPDQRVINIVMRPRFRAVTAEIGGRAATAGGYFAPSAELSVLRLGEWGRWNTEIEYDGNGHLLESERNIIQSATPFDLTGNITALDAGAEIDPLLSAAAGFPVTIAGVPGSAAGATPGLGAFVPGANNPNQSDIGRYRSLVGASDKVEINTTYSRNVGEVAASLNARVGITEGERFFGLPEAILTLPAGNSNSPFANDVLLNRYYDGAGALRRTSSGLSLHSGLTLDGQISPAWRWNFTANYDWSRTLSQTDNGFSFAAAQAALDANSASFNPYGPLAPPLLTAIRDDRVNSRSQSADAQLLLNGRLFALPAGNVTTSIRLGGTSLGLESESFRSGINDSRSLGRTTGNAQASIDVPIARRNRNGLGNTIGDLSFNFNGEVATFSDFGTLTTWGAGMTWAPIPEVQLIASYSAKDGAPSVSQLGDPIVLDENARVFDFLTGQTVDITRITGGNPNLIADSRRVFKLGANARLIDDDDKDLSLSANFTKTRVNNPIASFPTATHEIEAAFPDRFVRDVDGNLLSIDSRPVNFARSDREELRWGVTFSRRLQATPPPGGWEAFREQMRQRRQAQGQGGEGGPQPGSGPRREGAGPGGPGGGGGFRGGGRGGGGGFGGRGGGGGRIHAAIFHNWRLKDTVLIRPGVPVLDFLNGSAAGSSGGQPRHELDFQGGVFKDGFGSFLSVKWQSGTTVTGAPGGTGDLSFSPLTTVNLRLFADLSRQRDLVRKYPFLRGTRISFGLNNVLDSHVKVRDATGNIPLSYQGDYIDPVGRSVTLSLRKLFF